MGFHTMQTQLLRVGVPHLFTSAAPHRFHTPSLIPPNSMFTPSSVCTPHCAVQNKGKRKKAEEEEEQEEEEEVRCVLYRSFIAQQVQPHHSLPLASLHCTALHPAVVHRTTLQRASSREWEKTMPMPTRMSSDTTCGKSKRDT